MKTKIWNTDNSLLPANLDESAAKKDNFPLGTLRLYTGKMANGVMYSHIYVKTGGKKPWAYYATYPSAKAKGAMDAGAVIVVDGKAVGPATPENLKLFKVDHPHKGGEIPSLVKGGLKSLGQVTADGSVLINPEGVKEMETQVALTKGETPAVPAPDLEPAPAPAPPQVAPEPEFDPDSKDGLIATVQAYPGGGVAATKALSALKKLGAPYQLPADSVWLSAGGLLKNGYAAEVQKLKNTFSSTLDLNKHLGLLQKLAAVLELPTEEPASPAPAPAIAKSAAFWGNLEPSLNDVLNLPNEKAALNDPKANDLLTQLADPVGLGPKEAWHIAQHLKAYGGYQNTVDTLKQMYGLGNGSNSRVALATALAKEMGLPLNGGPKVYKNLKDVLSSLPSGYTASLPVNDPEAMKFLTDLGKPYGLTPDDVFNNALDINDVGYAQFAKDTKQFIKGVGEADKKQKYLALGQAISNSLGMPVDKIQAYDKISDLIPDFGFGSGVTFDKVAANSDAYNLLVQYGKPFGSSPDQVFAAIQGVQNSGPASAYKHQKLQPGAAALVHQVSFDLGVPTEPFKDIGTVLDVFGTSSVDALNNQASKKYLQSLADPFSLSAADAFFMADSVKHNGYAFTAGDISKTFKDDPDLLQKHLGLLKHVSTLMGFPVPAPTSVPTVPPDLKNIVGPAQLKALQSVFDAAAYTDIKPFQKSLLKLIAGTHSLQPLAAWNTGKRLKKDGYAQTVDYIKDAYDGEGTLLDNRLALIDTMASLLGVEAPKKKKDLAGIMAAYVPAANDVAPINDPEAMKFLKDVGAPYNQDAVAVWAVMGLIAKKGYAGACKTFGPTDFPNKQKLLDLIGHLAPQMGFPVPVDGAPPASTPASPANAPTADQQKLKDLVQFLQDVGFGDGKKQQDFLSSPTFQSQMKAAYGDDWQSKAAAGAAALGVSFGAQSGPPAAGVAAKKKKKDPAPAVSEPTSAETPAPPPMAPASGLLAPPPSPALSTLQKGASAKSLGGAGKKDFYSDAKGNKFLVKLAYEKDGSGKAKPFAAVVQQVFSTVALAVRPDHVPITADKDEAGAIVTVQPFYAGASTLENVSPSALSPQDMTDVASEHVLDWMMSQHDSYAGNFVRRQDGRVVGVDKEQAFRFFPDDKLDVDYNPNPIEPYYNQFWREFRDGNMNFDPTSLKNTIAGVEAISDTAYSEQLDKYAQAIWPSEAAKRAKFLKGALERKQNIRADFEGFVTALYRKRTGKSKGVFTFNGGWDETGKAPVTAPLKKKNMQTVTAKDWAVHLGLKEYPFKPVDGPNAGQSDPLKIVLKISKGSTDTMEKFLKDTQLTPLGPVLTGSYYNIAVLDKKDYDAVSFEQELEKPIEIDPEDSSAIVEIDAHKPAELNNDELKQVETAQLGPLGKRYSSDSAGIEGQYMRVKRVVDKSGSTYYQFQFKFRPSMVASIPGGSNGTYTFPKLAYQPGSDSVSEHDDSGVGASLSGTKYKNGSSEAFIYKSSDQYSFMNMCVVKVRPKAGQTVHAAFQETLEKMRPGLAAELLKNPTPEEREVAKLARLLWAAAPQESDKLVASDYTLAKLKEKLAKHGYDDSSFAKIEERETYSGLQSHVLPGRHKKLAKGKFRFMFNGISDLGAAVSVLKLGLLGISERAMMGIPLKGASVEADIGTGAGDQILARPVTENGLGHSFQNHSFSGKYQAIIDPAEADRLDSYIHPGDHFGSCNPSGTHSEAWNKRNSVEKTLEKQASSYSPGMEICFRKGISKTKILRMACATPAARTELIKAAKEAGIVEMNGVSIESFIIVTQSLNDAYQKAVVPAMQAAAAKAK